MTGFLEAIVLLLPTDAGGRGQPIAPREGSYHALAGSMPVRFIEGPPAIDPGQAARVVVELDTHAADEAQLAPGSELHLIEEDRVVGVLTVTRVWRSAAVV